MSSCRRRPPRITAESPAFRRNNLILMKVRADKRNNEVKFRTKLPTTQLFLRFFVRQRRACSRRYTRAKIPFLLKERSIALFFRAQLLVPSSHFQRIIGCVFYFLDEVCFLQYSIRSILRPGFILQFVVLIPAPVRHSF